jgi:hypothetical protein
VKGQVQDVASFFTRRATKSLGGKQFQARLVRYIRRTYFRRVICVLTSGQNDLTPAALTAHLNHLSSPPPLSASEAALAEVREAEAEEAKRTALDPEAEARRKRAIAGLGGKFSWGDGVADALDKCAKRSDDGWIVVLVSPCLSFH